jgi:muramoyltetrapeptide carboxypeptidase
VGTADGDSRANDHLVFLEDQNEPVYRLDRCLTQLLRSGWFTGVTGVILGSFFNCGDQEVLVEMLVDRLGPLKVPVLWGLAAGHGPVQHTLPFGIRVALDADSATIEFRD